MIDFRYHIYSLVAVFLALALGILIGAAFIGPGTADSKDVIRTRAQITELEKRFDTLRREISQKQDMVSATQARLDQTEQVCKALLPSAVAGRLAHKNVAIIQTSGSDEAVGAVRTALAQAGAKSTTFVRIENTLTPESDSLAQLAPSFGIAPGSPPTGLFNTALAAIVGRVVWGKDGDKLTAMEKSGLVSFSDGVNHWNKLVVIVGGAESEARDRAQTLDVPLIEILQEKGAEVVGCEDSDAKVSYIASYAGKGISTVDNIQGAAGQIGLIYALTGEHGNFGLKKTADRLIPRTLENPRS
jgi:hypothetical protein